MMHLASAQRYQELDMLRSTINVDAIGYVCQGDWCVFNIHIASLDTRAKTGISNNRPVSATLGICRGVARHPLNYFRETSSAPPGS